MWFLFTKPTNSRHPADENLRNEIRSKYDINRLTWRYAISKLILGQSYRNSHNINDEWSDRFQEIDTRLSTYQDLFDLHDSGAPPIDKKTILIDVMLDKAQSELKERSERYFTPGVILLFFSVVTITLFVMYLNFGDVASCIATTHLSKYVEIPSPPMSIDHFLSRKESVFHSPCYIRSISNWYDFTLLLVKRIVIGGAVLAIAYIFFALANACFRESTRLLHRRHSVRYIRLLLYRSEGNISDQELRDAFGIDDVTTSGFDSIKTETVSNNLIGRLIDRIGAFRETRTKSTIL